jgi:SAM-dependent methyltransferase
MCSTTDRLPPEFLAQLGALERAYLRERDPIRQSGFAGGAVRWRAEREPILDAVEGDGDLLDVGCANGYLAECLVAWGRERGLKLVPFGVDQSAALVGLACRRLPELAAQFWVANAWEWTPPRRFHYVYALHDCVPRDYLRCFVERLLVAAAAPGGRLTVGAYGSRSRQEEPLDISRRLASLGFQIAGESTGGDPVVSRFAWINA